MERSRSFNEKILNQEPTIDPGSNVTYDGFSLQTFDSWTGSVDKDKNNLNINKVDDIGMCFETSDHESFMEKVKSHNAELFHGTIEVPCGQRFIRFYDPDKHIIHVEKSLLKCFSEISLHEYDN